MQNQFTKLEKSVLEQFALGDDIDVKRLRVQLAMLSVETREYTDVGFKTTFSLLNDDVPVLDKNFENNQANVYADHSQTPAGAGFFLQCVNGKLKSLNGYVFAGNWPVDESEFRILKLNYSLINPQIEVG